MNIKGFYFKAFNTFAKIKFHLRENLMGAVDFALLTLNITDLSLNLPPSNKLVILFAGKTANFRVLKTIKWLHLSGKYKIILAVHDGSKMAKTPEHIDQIVYYRNGNHLHRILKASNIGILFAFTSSPKYAAIAIQNFKGVKIFDPYDCVVVYYGLSPHLRWMKTELPYERYCFEYADGIFARNLECLESLKMYGLPSPANIVFSDYCDNDNFTSLQKASLNQESEIHLVYSGGLYGKSARQSSHGIENFDDLIAALEPNKIHWHLYPSPMAPVSYYLRYIELAKKLNYLHIYPSVGQEQLGRTLSNYTFGILPHFKDSESAVLDAKLKYGTSNKFFNFLEAGLPIIVSEEMTYMAWVIKRYEIGIVVSRNDLENLRNIIISYDYIRLTNNVLKVREKLSMKNNIHRLIMFIEGLH